MSTYVYRICLLYLYLLMFTASVYSFLHFCPHLCICSQNLPIFTRVYLCLILLTYVCHCLLVHDYLCLALYTPECLPMFTRV